MDCGGVVGWLFSEQLKPLNGIKTTATACLCTIRAKHSALVHDCLTVCYDCLACQLWLVTGQPKSFGNSSLPSRSLHHTFCREVK